MLQTHANNIRCRLRLTASALVLATAYVGMTAGANAGTIVLTSLNTPYSFTSESGNTLEVTSGSKAYLENSIPANGTNPPAIPTGYLGIYDNTNWMSGYDVIQVDKGASIYVDNWQSWQYFDNVFKVYGDATFNQGETYVSGTNTFAGNLTIEAGVFRIGAYNWYTGNTTFGTNTNIILGSGVELYYYNSASIDNVINTISSANSTVGITLYSGYLTVNGVNTKSSSFSGTLDITSGATFTVGDATHSSAIFGDPTASAAVINVSQSSGSLGVLTGYGTIYGSVNNNGIVKPGGTSGTLGTLTIDGNYKQGSTGQLKVEISPTSASKLVVNGAATLDGSLVATVDSGTYGNAVYKVLSADSISGSLTLSTSGSASGVLLGLQKTSTSYALVTEKSSAAQTFGHAPTANRNLVLSFNRAIYDQIDAGLPDAGDKAAAGGEIRVWATPFGRVDDIGRDGVGYDVKYGGLIGGAEYHFPTMNAVVGGAFSYAHGSMDVKGEDTDATSDTYNLAIYGGADLQNARVDATIFYNGYDFVSKRHLGDYGTATAKPSGWSYGASFQVSRDLFDNLVTPYVRGIYSRDYLDSASEKGSAALALNFDKYDQTTFSGDIGVKVHVIAPTPDLKIKLDVTAAVAHDFASTKETVTGKFIGTAFEYNWKGNTANALLLGTEFSTTVTDGLDVFGRINGQFTTKERAGELFIGGRYQF